MSSDARAHILASLSRAPAAAAGGKPAPAPVPEAVLDQQGRIESFCSRFVEQTGIVYRHDPGREIHETLAEICRDHEIGRVIASCDPVLDASGLADHLEEIEEVEIRRQDSFADRAGFVAAVFEDADAGLTGAAFGVAESGTLVLAFDADHARLISLAPIVHIAVLPANQVVASYEQAVNEIFRGAEAPSQLCLITGPSMTADIQGMPFKGMHGPKKVIVLLV